MSKIKKTNLNEEQLKVAEQMLASGEYGESGVGYSLDRVDDEVLKEWADNEELEGREFYKECLEEGYEVWTLYDEWQELGEVAV